jgi:hypothetical protein
MIATVFHDCVDCLDWIQELSESFHQPLHLHLNFTYCKPPDQVLTPVLLRQKTILSLLTRDVESRFSAFPRICKVSESLTSYSTSDLIACNTFEDGCLPKN